MLVSARETIGDTELELVGFGLGYRRNSPRNAELEDAAVALAAKAGSRSCSWGWTRWPSRRAGTGITSRSLRPR